MLNPCCLPALMDEWDFPKESFGPIGDWSIARAIPAFAGHGNHYCGFGVAAAEACTGWSEVVLDEIPTGVCLLGGISVPDG